MVHPIFSNVPDRYAAEVFSEAMEPGAYKYFYSLEGTGFTIEDGFPPEPAALTTITAAFIAADGQRINRFGLHGISGPDFEPADEDLVAAYDNRVVSLQNDSRNLEILAPIFGLVRPHPEYGRLGQWCIEETIKDRKRLIAAHMIFVAANGKTIHEGLAYPTALKETFPLLVRNAIGELVLKREGQEEDPELDSYLQSVMQNREEAHTVAAVPPSTIMPDLEGFKEGLRIYRQS